MKIAVSSTGTDLGSRIDPRFGRCAYFLIVETEDMSFEACDNENNALGGGAGIQSAQFVASKGSKAVVTGNCGPNAVRTIAAAGLELYVGQAGTVRQAVEKLKNGELTTTNAPNVTDHYGMSNPAFGGKSGGMGRGQGGGGRGMGGGAGMSGGNASPPADSATLSAPEGEGLNLLKVEAAALKKQMEDIQARIDKLTKNSSTMD